MAVVLLFALVLASAAALAAGRGARSVVEPRSSTSAAATAEREPSRPASEPEPRAAALEPEAGVSSSIAQSPATIASSWSAGPQPAPAAPAAPAQPGAEALARQAAERFGVRIVLEGQDWGPAGASQEANVGAVISAMDRLPLRVTSSVVAHPHGPLTFVSNQQGRTVDGWQPYGGFPIAFYTNSDQGPGGRRPANQVVLITGSSDLSIAHEVLHAYTFRDVAPERYVLALLGEEMRSFMAATGWRQLASDDQLTETADDPWEAVNALFAYDGRSLVYLTATGSTVALTPPNPLEAFAVAGSIYYARPEGMALPDWPEYWTWFDRNLG